ncbi:MAG TPA: SpoIIE family protein phosphatase [Planctomycetota bacterium]|nr:SpoIIE family protein phosphatase [Planctomycetota bacterium]
MAANAPKALLEVEQANQPPRHLALGEGAFRIGRARDSDLHLASEYVSKQHAEIRFEGDGFHVIDMGSRAGITVNGKSTVRHLLADGDVVELGAESKVKLTFRASRPLGALAQNAEVLTKVSADPSRGGMARLARFFEFSRKLGGGFTLEEVLEDVVDLAIEVTGAERGMLFLLRADDTLETRVARTVGGQSLPKQGLRVSETLVRHAIQHGRPRIVADTNESIDLKQQTSIVALELRSAVTLPILRSAAVDGSRPADLGVFGVMYLDSRSRRRGFDGFDLDILERLAQDASSVIENARLLREAEDKKRMDLELETARGVQAALIPEHFQSTDTFEVAGACVPCNELGGDYVDQFDLGNGRQALVVADVCGKGIAASLLAAALQGALAAEIRRNDPLGEIVQRLNRVHYSLAPYGRFITLVVAVLEPDGTVRMVNAGHCSPLHVQAHAVTSHAKSGMALGLDEQASYTDEQIRMQPGDFLVLYTDGIVECEGPGRELFGEQRLEQLLQSQRGAGAAQVVAAVRGAADAFRRGVPVSDDLTVLVVRRV